MALIYLFSVMGVIAIIGIIWTLIGIRNDERESRMEHMQ